MTASHQNSESIDRETLLALASRHCTGELDAAGAQRLAAALRDSAAARRWFIEYMDLHSALAWECSSAADLDAAMLTGACKPQPATSRLPHALRPLRYLLPPPPRVALAVALVALAIFLSVLVSTPASLLRAIGWRNDNSVADESGAVVVAQVTAAIGCRWEYSAADLAGGSQLLAGQRLALVEGTAELTFVDGAVVTLTAPTTLVVESPSRGWLSEGRLAARVPEIAKGFTIRTPGATIVDRGTEFGVLVPPRDEATGMPLGREELHVFQGVVDVTFHNPALPPQRLLASEALRFASSAPAQTEPGGFEPLASSQRAKFPRAIDSANALTVAAPLAVEKHPPVTRGLALWLAADGALRCTSGGSVVTWDGMLAGDNRQAQVAKQRFPQRCPLWVADAFNGQPAIRFDGNDYLALPPADKLGVSGQAYELYIVARSSSPEVQFLIAGGTEEFEVHINGESGARFIPTGHFHGEGASDLQTPGAYSDGRPHLFVARVLPENRFRGVLAVDGRTSDDLTAADARGYSDLDLRLGMRFSGQLGLVGEIAEVLIYRQPLSDAERQQVQTYLSEKYTIPGGG